MALPRALFVFERPLAILNHVRRGTFPERVRVRSPIGQLEIQLRNFESLKTCFSIFAREDYRTSSSRPLMVLDLGANIGAAALYFLSRHLGTRVRCFEPDPSNLEYLRRNLQPFADRVDIEPKAVASANGFGTLFRATDGKHSSLIERVAVGNGFEDQVPMELVAFEEALRVAADAAHEVLVKVDVEGIEADLVGSVDFDEHPYVKRVLIESMDCSRLIARPHRRRLRNAQIEDLEFD